MLKYVEASWLGRKDQPRVLRLSRRDADPDAIAVQQRISVYAPHAVLNGGFGTVYLVVPETARLSVTDGGHRTNAIIEAAGEMGAEEAAEFDQDAIAAMITLESDLVQVHQDFADCSRTKPLPKSQLAAYDAATLQMAWCWT